MSTTQVSKKTRERTAFHEAGHAVVAYLLDRPFEYVSIEPHKESLGRIVCKRLGTVFLSDDKLIELSAETQRWIEETIQIVLAGPEVELRFFSLDDHDIDMTDDEHKYALGLASEVYFEPKKCSAYLEGMRIRTRNMLSAKLHRAAIEAVATALLARKTIDGDSVVKIINNVVNEA